MIRRLVVTDVPSMLWLRNEATSPRAHDRSVAAVDETIDVYIRAEVGGARRLTGAIARLLGIARIDKSIGIRVAQEDAHRNRGVACISSKRENDRLGVGHPGEVHGHLPAARAGATYASNACRDAGTRDRDREWKEKDHLMVAIPSASAAFDSGRAGQRQVYVKDAGTVRFPRYADGCEQFKGANVCAISARDVRDRGIVEGAREAALIGG